MKRAALYMRVSTLDQHPETQLYDLRQMAQQRGYQIVEQYTDRISGAKAKRPGLDSMMRDARRGRFDVVLVWASDRNAILRDRQRGHSLSQLAKGHLVSRATIHRVLKEHASTLEKSA